MLKQLHIQITEEQLHRNLQQLPCLIAAHQASAVLVDRLITDNDISPADAERYAFTWYQALVNNVVSDARNRL